MSAVTDCPPAFHLERENPDAATALARLVFMLVAGRVKESSLSSSHHCQAKGWGWHCMRCAA